MSGQESSKFYDDTAFNTFLAAVLGLILIPTTWSYIKKWKNAFASGHSGLCSCDMCKARSQQQQTQARKPSFWGILKFVVYLFIWYLFLSVIRSNSGAQSGTVVWDPYDVLGLSHGADMDEIKKTYRKLSLKWHPDKNVGNEEAANRYVDITKAYETLTDPAVREKWEKYGNPDGPQSISMGIALPSWLVDKNNSAVVLTLYLLGLVILVPALVIWFWNWQKSYYPNQVQTQTMQIYFQYVQDRTARFKKLVEALSASVEYEQLVPIRRGDEEYVRDIIRRSPVRPEIEAPAKKGKQPKRILKPYIIKDQALFFAHISRLHYQMHPSLREDLNALLTNLPPLISGLIETSYRFAQLIPTLESIWMSQMLVQAVWSDHARKGIITSNYQLPHLSGDAWKRLQANKKLRIQTAEQLAKASEEIQNQALADLTPEQRKNVLAVCKQMPFDLDMSVKAGIDDEDDAEITAGSIVTLTATFTRPSKPAPRAKYDEKIPPAASDLIEVHAPFLPIPKNELWYLIIGDERVGIVFNCKKLPYVRDKMEVKLPFQAPRKPGNYKYTVFLMCDSYVGFDKKTVLSIDVNREIRKKAEQGEEEEEDLDEEEEEPTPLPKESDSEDEQNNGKQEGNAHSDEENNKNDVD